MLTNLRISRMAAVLLAVGLMVAACTSASSSPEARAPEQPEPTPAPLPASSLPDLGPAPDITNEVWLNSEQPLNLAALQGKVVLVEFWTFG